MDPLTGPTGSVLRAGSDASTVRDDPRILRAEVDVVDFVLVTYRIPVERLERRLPHPLRLQTFPHQGRSWAFVSASCFLNRDLGWAGGPSPRLTSYQSTYRTYVTRGQDVGAFFFASHVSTRLGTWGQRLGLADTRLAQFDVAVERGAGGGYRSYVADIRAPDGRTRMTVAAERPADVVAPFASSREHVRFITHRLHGYAYSVLQVPVDAQVEHPEMRAYGGRLLTGSFPTLVRLGLVALEEQATPHSVLVSPGARFELLAPVPLRRRARR